MLAHFFVSLGCKFVISVGLVKVAMKTGFKCETIHNAEFTPHDNSCSFKFGLLHAEPAGVVAKLLCFFGNQLWNDAHSQILIRVEWLLWTIDEDVFLSGMAMHIDEC